MPLKQSQWSSISTDPRDLDAALVDPDLNVNLREESVAHTIVPAVAATTLCSFSGQSVGSIPRRCGGIESKRPGNTPTAEWRHTSSELAPKGGKKEYDDKLPHFSQPDLINDEPGDLHGYLRGDDIGGFGVERLARKGLTGQPRGAP